MKVISLVVSTAIFASFTFGADYTIKFSHVVSENTPKGKAAKFFEKKLEELSHGKIDVQIYPNSKLYNDKDVLDALKSDKVQMACPTFSKFTKDVPALALFDLPFLFKDVEHLHRVLDSKVGKVLRGKVTKQGFIALNYWDNNFKQLTTSKKTLINPEDAKGQKFRIMSSKVLEAQFDILGANSEKLPFSKVYSSLKNNTIDAQENTISNIYTKKFYQVQNSMTLSNHGYLGYLVVMSKKFWLSLPYQMKKLVIKALDEATKKEREYAKELNSKQLKLIEKYAIKSGKLNIIKLTDKQRMKWKKAVSQIYPQFYKSIGKSLITKAQSL